MAAQLEKVYQCLNPACKQDIGLARKDDGSGWIKYNLDNSLHDCKPKNNSSRKQPQMQPGQSGPQQLDNGPQLTQLAQKLHLLGKLPTF